MNPMNAAQKYAVTGALLGLGSPAGLFLLRAGMALRDKLLGWTGTEITGMMAVYIYTAVGSVVVFSVFGYLLGQREDALAQRTRVIEGNAHDLERLAITDGLTKLYSHSYLIKRLDEEFQRAKRYQYPLACLFIDIDNFKTMNDQHSHLFGDLVLTEIAGIMLKEIRDSDIMGRYGGDEFLCILPETDSVNAYKVAERIRKGVEMLNMQTQDAVIRTTVSIGVYASDHLPLQARDILELADSALHQAKNVGRNRCVLLLSGEDAYKRAVNN